MKVECNGNKLFFCKRRGLACVEKKEKLSKKKKLKQLWN